MDQYLLRYFLAVAEIGNFSRAAERVGVTQPTLSAGIVKLEGQLGARLFDRDKRSVVLTAAGSGFLVRARRIAREIDLAVQAIAHPPQARVLRIGILSTIPVRIVDEIVTRHREGGHAEALEMLDGSERELAQRLERGRLDVALTVVRPNQARFRPEPLQGERYLMVLPCGHPLADAEFLRAEELAGERMVLRRHCEALTDISNHFTQRGVRPRFVLKTTSDERMLAVVRAGHGVGMMPESFRDPGVRLIRLVEFDLQREVGLLYGHDAEALRYDASPFIRLVRERYGRV
jgi:DNA-binding transcriptional LysR family regulator